MTQAEIDIEINANVLAWFQAQGDDWQERISAALKSYAAAQGWSHNGSYPANRRAAGRPRR